MMPRIAVVTDSTSDLPEGLAQSLGIRVVPLNVHFGEEVYKDQVDIYPEEFYHKLQETAFIPRTSQPSPGEFLETYKNALADGAETILSIHISSKLSGTMGSARIAAQMLPDADIRVIDSGTVTAAMGLTVLEAATAASEGAELDTILSDISARIGDRKLLFVLDTLEYLQKNGRIGKAASLLGTLLNIKPILTVSDGLIAPFEKTRGRAKAIKRIMEVVQSENPNSPGSRYFAVVHSQYPEQAMALRQEILDSGVTKNVLVSEIGPVVGVHAGPGAIGVIY